MKRDGTCAIANFGLTLIFDSECNEINIEPNTRVGTRRYMASEVLDESLNKSSFESFKSDDIYTFGLVLWRRTLTGEKVAQCEDYQPPYHNCVPSDPSFEDMYQVVCVKDVRHEILVRWNSTETLRTLFMADAGNTFQL